MTPSTAAARCEACSIVRLLRRRIAGSLKPVRLWQRYSGNGRTGGLTMPMSGAERQRRYRERHRDDLARITLDVQVAVRDRLDRLAWHFQWNLTQLVEELAARAEHAVEGQLSGDIGQVPKVFSRQQW
jgi:hypothetical protein